MSKEIYNISGANRFDKARYILAMMSPDMVQDIVQLIGVRGNAVVDDIFGENNSFSEIPRTLGVLSREYIRDEDAPNLVVGLSTILLSAFRQETWGVADYKTLLKQGWGLPEALALIYAEKIETKDKIPSALAALIPGGDEANQGIDKAWSDFTGTIKSRVASLVNSVTGWLGIPWTMNTTQKFDSDFLFELSQLGGVVMELNRRGRLISANQMWLKSMNGAGSGDPYDDPQETADRLFGDVLSNLAIATKEIVPAIFQGTNLPVVNQAKNGAISNAIQLLQSAGYKVDNQGNVTSGGPVLNPFIKRSLDNALSGAISPTMAAALGFKGQTDQQTANPGAGDPVVYHVVKDEHGPKVAKAWLKGDVDTIVKESLKLADQDVSTGDPDLDSDIENAYGDVAMGDANDLAPEIGGLLTRFRLNAAKARYLRRKERSRRRGGRKTLRKNQQAATRRYQQMAEAENTSRYYNPDDVENVYYPSSVYEDGEGLNENYDEGLLDLDFPQDQGE